jgi:hypothetical protein
VKRDWEYTKPETDATLLFLHRTVSDGDVYFVDNRLDRAEDVDVTFRIDGKVPEIWDAATGESQPVSYSTSADGRTLVPLNLDPYGTTFVVFRKPATKNALEVAAPRESEIGGLDSALNNDWNVSFERGKGIPESIGFRHLISWSDSPLPLANEALKYYSGTATYSKSIDVPADDIVQGAHLWLDLGDVRELAEVKVNGVDLGILWKTPFRVDVTGAIKPGENKLEIRVTNLWVNRMIGDQQPWAMKKYAFADFAPYKADSPLLPSGLLGPVRLMSETQP